MLIFILQVKGLVLCQEMRLMSGTLRPFVKATAIKTAQGKRFSFEVTFILLVMVWTVFSEYPVFQSVVGRSAHLLCNVSVTSEDDSISLVLWYKLGISAPIFSVDSRHGPLERSKHFTSVFLGKRGYFDPGTHSQPSVLTIDPVEKNDEGKYRCRIDFRYGRTFNRIVMLKVIVPPQDVTIVDETNQPVYGEIGPYNEGSKLALGCLASGGKPPPAVTWWKDSVQIDNSFRKIQELEVRNDYILQELKRDDLLAKLTCQASNNNLTSPLVATVTIDINLKPLEVFIISTYPHVSANRQFEIECHTTGSRPSSHITWWLGNRKMESSMETFSEGGNRTVSKLVYTPFSEDNESYLSCKSENPLLPGRVLEDGITLNVFYSPKVLVKLRRGQVAQKIQTGDDVYLYCQCDSNPEVLSVQWLFENVSLRTNSQKGIFVRNQSLVLKNVSRDHSGTYRCFAENKEGRGNSEGFELFMKYAPICKKGQKIAYAVTVDELVEVLCEVESDPDDVIFTWVVNNTKGSRELLTFTTTGLQSMARHIPREANDFGYLACKAQNVVGEQTEPCIFTLISVGPPSPPYNCSVSNSTNLTLLVRCTSGEDGGLQQNFHLEAYLLPRNQIIANLSKSNKPVFLLSTLPSEARFFILVYSSNAKGRSDVVTLITRTLALQATKSSSLNIPRLRPLLGTLLGIVGAFILMAVILVILFRRMKTGKQTIKADGQDQRKIEKCTSLTQNFTHNEAVTSSDPDLISLHTNSPIRTSLLVHKQLSNRNIRGSIGHSDQYVFQSTTAHQSEVFNFNGTREWAMSRLNHRPQENLELIDMDISRMEQKDNGIQTHYERLSSLKPSYKGQVYPVREYRRYTPV
ncbi:cell adhesion molecule CEACAM5-like [Tachypleus tridentatus]|uniref:cell adhesion molecule CEACAM5-like n=1 Tax=Tachypleus tridentatus TaxID=6853 RepID=UPI003FD1C117